MDESMAVYDPGFVLIGGDSIVAVGPLAEAPRDPGPETRVLSAEGRLVLPGLINGHQHAAMSLLRGLADDLRLMDWLQGYIFPAEAALVDEDFVYWGTLLSVVEMIRTGTTTYCDMYYFEGKVAEATAEAGMRGILGQTVIGFPAPDYPTPEEALAGARQFVSEWKGHPLISPAVAPHAAFTCSEEVLVASRRLADELDVPLLMHVSEDFSEVEQLLQRTGRRPIDYLDSIGFLVDRLTAFHVVWPDDAELEMLRAAGVGVIHNPRSNMKLAAGVAPVPTMLELGLAVGLGTDGPASTNNLDLFEEMATASKLHKVTRSDPTVTGAREVLSMATRGSADALNRPDLGRLSAGARADLIVLSLEGAAARPFYDPYSTAVHAIRGHAVSMVIIGGEVVYADGLFSRLDVEAIYAAADRYRDRAREVVAAAAGSN